MEWHPDVRSASVEPGVPLQSSYQLRSGLRAPSHLPPPRSAAVHYCLWGDPHRGQYATTPGFVGRLTAPIVQGRCSAGAHGSPTTRRHSRAPARGVMATADTRIGTDGTRIADDSSAFQRPVARRDGHRRHPHRHGRPEAAPRAGKGIGSLGIGHSCGGAMRSADSCQFLDPLGLINVWLFAIWTA